MLPVGRFLPRGGGRNLVVSFTSTLVKRPYFCSRPAREQLPSDANCGVDTLVSDMVSKAMSPKAKRPYWKLPCRANSSAEEDEIVAACFPTFPQRILPLLFSCDWEKSEVIIHHTFNVPGKPLRPLAYVDAPYPTFLVAAGKEYVFWDGTSEDLTRFGSNYSSDEDFFARIKGLCFALDMKALGVVQALPRNYQEIYRRLAKEQRQLVRTVEGRIVKNWP
ncbi:hypothetical protein B0H19DRAFT_1245359 [Mycena capillaripes]|nr:hypothetical protein B0H19DRAFT_1245359 [Mycena capillaripes]